MSPEIRVAVCTNRRPEQAADCLRALARQVDPDRIAVVTSGLPGELVERHRAASPGTVLAEPRAGLSHARNRALAWCGAGDVVAFVDDDAVPREGWHAALEAAWAEAADDVACIGGPIHPRWAAPRPPWLADEMLPALTVLDLGAQRLRLDPEVTAVFGANVSFRAAPLRAAGGFDPSYGHRGDRTFFGEEDQAQRALARLGFGTVYDPGPVVDHLVPPGRATRAAVLRRRFGYGAALGMRGGRGPGAALAGGLRSAAGCVTAAAGRREELMMLRAYRVAENAGVLLGPLVLRH